MRCLLQYEFNHHRISKGVNKKTIVILIKGFPLILHKTKVYLQIGFFLWTDFKNML